MVSAASDTASARGWPPSLSSQPSGTEGTPRAIAASIIALASGSASSPTSNSRWRHRSRSRCRRRFRPRRGAGRPARKFDHQRRDAAPVQPCAGPPSRRRRGQYHVGALPDSRATSAAASAAVPCRLKAVTAIFTRARSLGPPVFAQQGQGEVDSRLFCAAWQHGHAVQAGDLAARIHLRGAGDVLHVLAWEYRADLAGQRADLCSRWGELARPPAGRARRQFDARWLPNQGLSSIVPSARSRQGGIGRITAVRAAGMRAMLVTSAPLAENTGLSGV